MASDDLSDSDGLDLVKYPAPKQNLVSFDEYFSSLNSSDKHAGASSDHSDNGTKHKPQRRQIVNRSSDLGERITLDSSEDDGAARTSIKQRNNEQRMNKQVSSTHAKAQKRKRKSGTTNLIISNGTHKTKRRRRERIFGDPSSDDEEKELPEKKLPAYLQSRRTAWDKKRGQHGVKCLRFPPDFEDIEFGEDTRLGDLQERPQFLGAPPRNQYRDIDMEYSLGTIPASIAQWLRDYQIEGTKFLHKLFVYQEGGILGDDMGLGKTIQVIAFLTAAFGKTGDERDAKRMRRIRRQADDPWYPIILLICPASVLTNWQQELEKWGWWHSYLYHGTQSDKQGAIAAARSGRLEIMITTYNTYRLDASIVNEVRWDAVVADECHQIKERRSETTKKMMEVNALCRIGLTGTAIQNNYDELWTLLNWANPGVVGLISTWKETISTPLKLGQSHDATVAQVSKARKTALLLKNNLLKKFMLRRTKDLIADQLPKKSDRVIFCPLTPTQEDAYNEFVDSELMLVIRNAHEPCPCGSRTAQGSCCYTKVEFGGELKPWQSLIFPAMQFLQSLSCHLAMTIPSGKSPDGKDERKLEMLQIACPATYRDLHSQRDSIMTYANYDFCGKWRILRKLLKLWHDNGDKVLVFSHSVKLLTMLNSLFQTTSYNVSYLDGKLQVAERQRVVDDFNADPNQFVFLISTRAGGMGLNITSANKVVIIDPNWNPAYDLQAQDRAYRIGQTRDVEVYRLISQGTIEEQVYARQIYKQQQANIGYNASLERRYFSGVQNQKEMKGEIFGLKNLIRPVARVAFVKEIVNKTNIAESRAGFEVAGLDIENSQLDDDDGDESSKAVKDRYVAMSRLAQEIIDIDGERRWQIEKGGDKSRRVDPVQAILASVGVQYTHENTEVIGTSKVETKISSRAQKAGQDFDWGREVAFGKLGDSTRDGDELGLSDDDDGKIRYRYQPPEDVKRRQFCSMAKWAGYDDVTEFALVVGEMKQAKRRNFLDNFYLARRELLGKA